ncbi:hypothetical protein [Spirosoma foliorum]|uniref:Uncharacterized protein n=1 Tax=Spirosoma foliorum TaxID=2710596 RepID=A0A7G5GY68_9BACT|nr:hypothetical protein [Spirosoma foliorum]QMW03810.1 hypothetical protein H3H32_02300 [Spirosoma foliorum]
MNYYFYAYFRNPKVTLHVGSCRFCNNGKGMQPKKLGYLTGRWRGGYASFELALEAAQGFSQDLGVQPVYCQRCFPGVTESNTTQQALSRN